MKSISIFAIVSIIAILLAIGLIYFVAKPPKTITTTSYIPTTYTETTEKTVKETYIITTTYITTKTITSIIPPITITQTITQTLTFTYIPEEKVEAKGELRRGSLEGTYGKGKCLTLEFTVRNVGNSPIYIDPNRNVTIEGKGILSDNHLHEKYWITEQNLQRKPFFLGGSIDNPVEAKLWGIFYSYKDYPDPNRPTQYNPEELEVGQQYRVSFDYKVIYLNGTWSDWKTYTFNVTYVGGD